MVNNLANGKSVNGKSKPRVALVTDWMYGGGGERVVEQLHQLYPEAPIYTSYCSDDWREKLDNKVVTGYLQHSPFRQLRKFLPMLRQRWFARLDLSEFDLVISITGNGEAKFVLSKSGKWQMKNNSANDSANGKSVNGKSNMKKPLHISYCHTPVHFYWRHYDEYLKHPGFKPKWLARLGLKLLVKPLRERDYAAAQKVDYLLANSSHIQADIKEFYGRDSQVIHPPVGIERFADTESDFERDGFIIWGRHVPMKRFDLAVQACNELRLSLTVIGSGATTRELQAMAGPTITFLGQLTDEELVRFARTRQAFIFPSFEDFGISPVEAMAAGMPVVAYQAGGALDYIVPGRTGEFFEHQTVQSLKDTLQNFQADKYDAELIQKHAEQFSAQSFRDKLQRFIDKA